MLETLMLKVFTEGGLIYLLFFLIIAGFLKYGIPFFVKKFEDMSLVFSNTLKEMQAAHREDMNTISEVFITQIKESNTNHTITHAKLEEIKTIINKK